MEKEKWIVRLIFSNRFITIAALMVTAPLQWYFRSYALLFLTVSFCALVGLLLGRINRLEESLQDLRKELKAGDDSVSSR